MHPTPKALITIGSLTLISTLSSQAQVIWDGGGIGDDWSTPENWVGDAIPGSGSIAQVDTGGVSIDVTTNVQAARFSNQDGSGALATVNILSGSLEETGNVFAGRYANGSNTVFNINGGDLLGPAGGDIYGPDTGNTGSVTFNITSGGVYNYTRFRYANTVVNLSGGILEMGAIEGVPTGISFQNSAALNMSGSGTFIFNVYGNGLNDTLSGGSQVDMTGGIISFRFDDTYTPQIGDSFDFLNAGITVDGTGSNISTIDADGKYLITWDTSGWGTTPDNPTTSQGVLTIDNISPIPEPGEYALLVGLAMGIGVYLRRRLR